MPNLGKLSAPPCGGTVKYATGGVLHYLEYCTVIEIMVVRPPDPKKGLGVTRALAYTGVPKVFPFLVILKIPLSPFRLLAH